MLPLFGPGKLAGRQADAVHVRSKKKSVAVDWQAVESGAKCQNETKTKPFRDDLYPKLF